MKTADLVHRIEMIKKWLFDDDSLTDDHWGKLTPMARGVLCEELERLEIMLEHLDDKDIE
jgi:hypothetical protein